MQITRREAHLALAAAASGLLGRESARAATWPDGPVALVCPYPAGGPNDLLARLVAKALSESIGALFIVAMSGVSRGLT